MIRTMMMIASLLLLGGCGEIAELVSQTRTVAAPREEVFARMFGRDGSEFAELPLVTNGGSTRLHEAVIRRGEKGFAKFAPKERPDAETIRLAVTMEIPRETHIIYDVDEGALKTGLKFTFEELAPGQTRVRFQIDDLTGHASEGLTVNAVKLHAIARSALDRLDDFDTVPGAG